MNLEIRKANKDDVNEILNLFNSDPNLMGDSSLKFNKNHILEFINHPINETLVCELGNSVVGIIQTEFWKTAKYILINDLIVDKRYRRKGIGTNLIKHIERLAKKRGMGLLFGFSEANNKKAHHLLRKLNYRKGKKFIFFSKELK